MPNGPAKNLDKYIYIYTNLPTKSTYGDRQKEKKTSEFEDKN